MVLSLKRFEGKVAIVTGASAGIGALLAEKLVEQGLQVVGLARRSERIKELAKKLSGKKGKLHAVTTDFTKEEDILKAFKWTTDNLGPVHILINSAGLMKSTSLIDGETQKWKDVFDVNVIGLCIATREATRIMRANNIDGHIVHISSVVGHIVPNLPGVNVYPASKYAVRALTETLRQELNAAKTKIKITCISPGAVSTEFISSAGWELDPAILNNLPFLQSEDVTDAIIYALSTPPHVQVHDLIIKPVGEII